MGEWLDDKCVKCFDVASRQTRLQPNTPQDEGSSLSPLSLSPVQQPFPPLRRAEGMVWVQTQILASFLFLLTQASPWADPNPPQAAGQLPGLTRQ